MAVFQFNDPHRGQMSRGLASGITGALEHLTQSKIKEIDRQRIAQGLQGIGFDEKEAKGLSQLPEDLQKAIITSRNTQGNDRIKRIEAHNKPFETQLEKEFASMDQLKSKVKEWKDLLASGKVASGLSGKVKPRWMQNKETQRFDQIGDEVAALLAGGSGSIGGIGKIRFYKGAKPTLDLSSEAQRAGIDALEKQLEQKDKMKDVLTKLYEENNYQPIEGLKEKFRSIVKNFDQQGGQTNAQSGSFNQLPDPAEYAGKIMRQKETGQLLKSDGNRWVPFKG